MISLRPWQREVLDAIPEVLEPNTNIFINAPTGSGKTILSLMIGSKLDVDLIIVVTRTRNEGFRCCILPKAEPLIPSPRSLMLI